MGRLESKHTPQYCMHGTINHLSSYPHSVRMCAAASCRCPGSVCCLHAAHLQVDEGHQLQLRQPPRSAGLCLRSRQRNKQQPLSLVRA